MPIQQTLALNWHGFPHAFETFRVGQNTVAYQILLQWLQQSSPFTSLYLWGDRGCGKTHLLQAACRHISERGGLSAYLPLADLLALPTDVLEGLENMDLVCVDDIQIIAGVETWEQAVFSLYNLLKDNKIPLLLAAHVSPTQLNILADLISRFQSGGVYRLETLSETDQCLLLQAYAAELGLVLPENIAHYFINKNNNLKTTIDWIEQLDGLAIGKKRKLSLHFVKDILNIGVI
jgi:DnaA-homolog protein